MHVSAMLEMAISDDHHKKLTTSAMNQLKNYGC